MTLAGWSFRTMPLQYPQEPIITEKKNSGDVSLPRRRLPCPTSRTVSAHDYR
jgi:hypothetical protein